MKDSGERGMGKRKGVTPKGLKGLKGGLDDFTAFIHPDYVDHAPLTSPL